MNESFRLGKQVYLVLLFVLLLGLLLQVTRSQTLLRVGSQNATTVSLLSLREDAQHVLDDAEVAALDEPVYTILVDKAYTPSVRVANNVEQTLRYMKKPYKTVDYRQFEPAGLAGNEHNLIVTFMDLDSIPNNGWLDTFVENGGNLFFAMLMDTGDAFYRIYRKMGVIESGYHIDAKGVKLNSEVLASANDASFEGDFIENTVIQVRLAPGVELHATSSNRIPLMWQYPYGKGRFVVFNGTMLQEKSSRGFIAAGISMMVPDSIYPILNVKLMYIDDFPAPFNAEYIPEYDRPYNRFIKEIWWPDMIRSASTYNFKFTGAVIENYDNNVKPPFDRYGDAPLSDLIIYGRDVLKSGGEIGIHGYNHQSLVTDRNVSKEFGYEAWPSSSAMETSIRTVTSFIASVFPNYTLRTYVPPSNVLSPEGREALKAQWPSLRTISSLYNEDDLKLAYEQEYSIADDGIVELPRVTSGFFNNDFERWASMNAAATLGVFSHFVHPDDVTDKSRNHNQTWQQLYQEFTGFLQYTNEQYGWLRPKTATEATDELVRYIVSEPHFRHTAEGVEGYINGFTGNSLYYLLRTDKRIGRLSHAHATRLNDHVYLIEAKAAHFTIGLEG